MQHYVTLIAIFCVSTIACHSDKTENITGEQDTPDAEMVFDKSLWAKKEGEAYPYRDRMLHDVVYNDTIRTLNKEQVVDLLGDPDRTNDGYLYYSISRKGIGAWTLHAKTMVIKLTEDDGVEWIKIHE